MYIFVIIVHLLYIINILKDIENVIFKLNEILYKENLYNKKYNIYINGNLYYQYNKNYTIRNYIDCKNKKFVFETIISKNIKNQLNKEIINTFINLNKYINKLKKHNINYDKKLIKNIIKYFFF